MKVVPTPLSGVLLVEPQVFGDDRGFFFESFNKKRWREATGLDGEFVQDNHSKSAVGVLRGLHYQVGQPQGKLVRVIAGEIFDVAVDLRPSSPTFKKWHGEVLSGANKRQLWVPEGFAHGFITLSESAEVLYKATDYYLPEAERSIRWDDAELSIAWPPVAGGPLLSAKDGAGMSLGGALAEMPFK